MKEEKEGKLKKENKIIPNRRVEWRAWARVSLNTLSFFFNSWVL